MSASSHDPVRTLETERLLLRSFREDDIDAYAAMCADPEVMRYLGARGPLDRDDAQRQMAMFVGPLAHAFGRLAWQRVISLIDPDNRRSIRLAERLGERFERTVTVRGFTVSL